MAVIVRDCVLCLLLNLLLDLRRDMAILIMGVSIVTMGVVMPAVGTMRVTSVAVTMAVRVSVTVAVIVGDIVLRLLLNLLLNLGLTVAVAVIVGDSVLFLLLNLLLDLRFRSVPPTEDTVIVTVAVAVSVVENCTV